MSSCTYYVLSGTTSLMDTVRTHTQVVRSGRVNGRMVIRYKGESYMHEERKSPFFIGYNYWGI
jgi:hypothetical protein